MKTKKISTLLLNGFLALLPLGVTFYIGNIIFKSIKEIMVLILPYFPDGFKDNRILFFIVVLGTVLSFLILLSVFGLLLKTIIGKAILKFIRSIFLFIPGLSSIYKATEQVASIMSNEKNNFFSHPILVEYPSAGIWTIAFNTGEIDVSSTLDKQIRYTVFIPTTPNPTSGFLAIMTKDKIKEFNIPAEDAIKLILTGGIVK